jgi:tetratricopeptide (TPR) repeat protein
MRDVTRLAVVVIAVVTSLPAAAEDDSAEKQQARLLLSQGNAYFERGDLRAALVNFRAAYNAYPSPKLLVNAAAAERELGDQAGAATDLRHFLDDASDDDQGLVERARADLKALERKVARIGIGGWPARSTLEIDGRPARDPTYVRPGTHSVKGVTPAGGVVDKDVELGAGDAVDLPAPPPPKSSSRALAIAPGPGGNVDAVKAKKAKNRALAIGLGVGGGLLLIGAGIGIGVWYYETNQTAQPLTGPLGTYHFGQFQ